MLSREKKADRLLYKTDMRAERYNSSPIETSNWDVEVLVFGNGREVGY